MRAMERERSLEHHLVLAALVAAPLAMLALGAWLVPDPRGFGTHEQLGFRPCWPMSRWNVPCPGCGVTTALALLVRGRVLAAVATQPFGPAFVASAFAAASWALAVHRRGRELPRELVRPRVRVALRLLGFGFVAAWLYKLAAVRGWL
jgi:hypothetical protein